MAPEKKIEGATIIGLVEAPKKEEPKEKKTTKKK